MALHLIKLCVGCDSVADLEAWIAEKQRDRRKRKLPREHVHTTRMTPKREAELRGGSLFWVIRGEILCRQPLVRLEPFTDAGGIGRCRLVLTPEVVVTEPRPCRPFQGWRYLRDDERPRDLRRLGTGLIAMPDGMRRELRELGLL